MNKILVVEDERAIADILVYNLQREGYEVSVAYDGMEALEKIYDENPNLILLDIMLPKLDGFEVCRKVREKLNTPIIMLTARGSTADQVQGLELGADDYIKKPFVMKELLARVKANLRRMSMMSGTTAIDSSLIEVGNLTIDEKKFEITIGGKVLDLTLREYELIKHLSKDPGKVYTREELLSEVWGYEYYGDLRTVDVTISRLRDKLKSEDDLGEEYISTKRGRGYYLNIS